MFQGTAEALKCKVSGLKVRSTLSKFVVFITEENEVKVAESEKENVGCCQRQQGNWR